VSAGGGPLPRWLEHLYEIALRAYPGALIERHGEEMREVVVHRWQRLRRRRWARTRMLLYLTRDLRANGRRRRPAAAFLSSVAHDVRFGLRSMRRAPAFTVTTVLTLALAIGANAAIFSVINAVLLEPLPYPGAERIQRLMPDSWGSARQVDAVRAQMQAFDAVAGVGQAGFTLREGTPERVVGIVAWPAYLQVFGVRPALGRLLREEDARASAEPVVMLSHRLWTESFGADPGVLGRTIALEGEGNATHTVVGVLPQEHDPFPWPAEVAVPVRLQPTTDAYADNHRYWMVGRLAGAATVDEAETELRTLVAWLAANEDPVFSRDDVARASIASFREVRVGDTGTTLLVMLAAVGVVLLIACVNVANIALARSGARRSEVATRAALGAGRPRIVRQLLTESMLLGLAGGTAGLVLAYVGIGPLASILPTTIPRQADVRVDGTVLAFAVLTSVGVGLLFGLAPALSVGRDHGEALHGVRGTGVGRGRNRLQALLLAGEVALAVVLLMAAGLLGKSLWQLQQVDPGFDPTDVVTFHLAPASDRYADAESRAGYYRRVVRQIRSVAGVREAGAISALPVSSSVMGVGISPDGNPVPEGESPTICSYRAVTPGAFAALGVRLLEGRLLDETDRQGSRAVGVVNRRLADMLWPGESPLEREVMWSTGDPWFTVVGVIEDIHQGSLAQRPEPEAYVSYAQQGTWLSALYVVIRHRPGVEVLAAARSAAWEVDDDVPITQQGSLTEQLSRSMAGERGWALVFGSFAALALILAAVGVSGVMSYLVAQRRHEVGVRVALGASRGDVVIAVLRIGLLPVGVGLASGAAGALAGSRFLQGLLHDVEPTDPAVLAAVVAFLAAIALVANLLPALRASRIDPVGALRSDS
jgi:putative ABC transport system permease protein